MWIIYKWLEFFFLHLSEMFASCAKIGMVATLKAEYMQDAQNHADQIDGSVDDPGPEGCS